MAGLKDISKDQEKKKAQPKHDTSSCQAIMEAICNLQQVILG